MCITSPLRDKYVFFTCCDMSFSTIPLFHIIFIIKSVEKILVDQSVWGWSIATISWLPYVGGIRYTKPCVSRLSKNKIKLPVPLTIALKVSFDHSRQNSVSAHAFFWKYTSTSLSQDAFSTSLNLFIFHRKIIASFVCSHVGRKQTFKVQTRLLSPVFGCQVRTFLFRFSFDLLSLCSYVLVVSLAKGRGDWYILKRCRGRYLPHFLS